MSSKLKSLIAIAAVAIAASFSNVPAQADELEKLKETGEMRIAMSGQYPPFSFTNEKTKWLVLTHRLAPKLRTAWA